MSIYFFIIIFTIINFIIYVIIYFFTKVEEQLARYLLTCTSLNVKSFTKESTYT